MFDVECENWDDDLCNDDATPGEEELLTGLTPEATVARFRHIWSNPEQFFTDFSNCYVVRRAVLPWIVEGEDANLSKFGCCQCEPTRGTLAAWLSLTKL